MSSNALALIQAVNTLLALAAQAQVSWQQLRKRIDLAAADGRPFGAVDLAAMSGDADAALRELEVAIEVAREEQRAKGAGALVDPDHDPPPIG